MKTFSKYNFYRDSTLARGVDFDQKKESKNFKRFVWIVAEDLGGTPITSHYRSIIALAKVHKMRGVIITENRIIASHYEFDILIKHLVNSIYLN